jgi:hypothetical protein
MIRGIDFITLEIYGLMQSYDASIEECQLLVNAVVHLNRYEVKVLRHRQDSGFIDIALYPKNGDKRKFIKLLKEDGFVD